MSEKSAPKDVFMHLLSIIALYISAVSFGALVFQFIDRWFPDPLTDYHAYSVASSAVRWAIASLVVVFPTYVLVSRSIQKDLEKHSAKRELKIRRWLLYFTLFAAAAVIIGDLVVLIYNFLGGDFSARFVLKVATVLFIAAAAFIYYLWNLRNPRSALADPKMRWFAWGVILVVAAGVVYGFWVAGSPFAERLRRFDERKIQDLQTIQWQVINYWQRKDKLPARLEELRDDISGFVPPRDPETGEAYEYRTLETLRFELCAAFKTSSVAASEGQNAIRVLPKAFPGPGNTPAENWAHDIGRACFERAIDPELYRLKP